MICWTSVYSDTVQLVSANSNIWYQNSLYVFATVVRIAAAVYEAIGLALDTMQKDMKNMESASASLSQKVVTDGLFTWFFHFETQLASHGIFFMCVFSVC